MTRWVAHPLGRRVNLGRREYVVVGDQVLTVDRDLNIDCRFGPDTAAAKRHVGDELGLVSSEVSSPLARPGSPVVGHGRGDECIVDVLWRVVAHIERYRC